MEQAECHQMFASSLSFRRLKNSWDERQPNRIVLLGFSEGRGGEPVPNDCIGLW